MVLLADERFGLSVAGEQSRGLAVIAASSQKTCMTVRFLQNIVKTTCKSVKWWYTELLKSVKSFDTGKFFL